MGVNVEKPKEMNSLNNSEVERSQDKEGSELSDAIQYNKCYNCQDKVKSRNRIFSEESWKALLLWNEINPNTVEKPICDYCYHELRSILMERNDEMSDGQL